MDLSPELPVRSPASLAMRTAVLQCPPEIPPGYSDRESLPIIPGHDVIRRIGRGGMSQVFLARHRLLNRMVAVKTIRPQDRWDLVLRKRFLREASSIAALQHPNVVQINEVGESAEGIYLSLEYMSGGNLQQWLQHQLPSPRRAAAIVLQLANAIQAAHDHQVIHRDLKPANVLVGEHSPDDSTSISVKIADFGLARILGESADLSQSGFAVGTPAYMSPEQASGHSKQVGKPADIYGLGAILYELITGLPPFFGASTRHTVHRVLLDPPERPRRIKPELPKDLESICLKCLEKLPGRRYLSAADLSDDLRRFLEGKTVKARPLTLFNRVGHAFRQRPIDLTISAIGLAAAVTMGLVLTLVPNAEHPAAQRHAMIQDIHNNATDEFRSVANDEPGEAVRLPASLTKLYQEELEGLADRGLSRFEIQLRVGEEYLRRPQLPLAIKRLEQARRLADEQTRKTGSVDAWHDLALATERLGDAYQMNLDLASCRKQYDRAMALREMFNQDEPENARYSLELADLCRKQALLFEQLKEHQTAVLLWDRRLGLLKDSSMAPADAADGIVEVHNRLAELHRKLGNPKAMEMHLSEAAKLGYMGD